MAPTGLALPSTALSWHLSVRAFRCWLTVYRRIWRSSIWSSVLGPVCYLGALGFGLGTLVDKHSTASLGGVSYLAFVAPAILASGAIRQRSGRKTDQDAGRARWSSAGDARGTPVFIERKRTQPRRTRPDRATHEGKIRSRNPHRD